MANFYVTTPIYYVNDAPHVGHVYTTTLADVVARYHRLSGDRTFFLTGTDEHATKVVDAAAANGMSTQAWADKNAEAFAECFEEFCCSHDDFMRTSQERHKERVLSYVQDLLLSGAVYVGEYEGWYDAGQEEYVTDAQARQLDYYSAINKKPLVRKREENFFFRLSGYTERLLKLIESDELRVQPAARKQEVLARIREGLRDVPISRTGSGDWGIRMPGHDQHTIYVWIDALFNYLSAVDTSERRDLWPANVHLIGKDILWFHAVIWPALLLALSEVAGNEWMLPPRCVHAHSFWIREGEKMSKSMGNFVDLQELRTYVENFGLDALRYYLVTNGPLGATDADFAKARFVDVYNTDLANTFGNSLNRVSNMINRYFKGQVPVPGDEHQAFQEAVAKHVAQAHAAAANLQLDGFANCAMGIVRAVDRLIQDTEPFKMIKREDGEAATGSVLYHAAEALRIASVLLAPIMPERMGVAWNRLGLVDSEDSAVELCSSSGWGGLVAGMQLQQGSPLFPRWTEE